MLGSVAMITKNKVIETIYKSAMLEGIKVKYEEILLFFDNVNTGNIHRWYAKIKRIKRCLGVCFKYCRWRITIDYIKKIHFEICKGQGVVPLGEFRDKGVGITGTNYRPKLPRECNYDDELKNIMNIDSVIDRCITLFLWIQRSQMFLDGNKRVANLVANKEMIKNGMGILAVPVKKIGEYFTLLINFYETNDYTEIKKWIYENCIDGLN